MLEVHDVSFSYDNEKLILDSVNLQVRRGEIAVITGPIGTPTEGTDRPLPHICGFQSFDA